MMNPLENRASKYIIRQRMKRRETRKRNEKRNRSLCAQQCNETRASISIYIEHFGWMRRKISHEYGQIVSIWIFDD